LKPSDLIDCRFAVVSHDAGSANQIAAMLRAHSFASVSGVFEGPAKKIFQAAFPGAVHPLKLSDRIREFDVLLCGSSGKASVEKDAVRLAASESIRSVTLVDANSNLLNRFSDERGTLNWPSELWSTSSKVLDSAGELGCQSSFTLVENYYLLREVKETRRRIYENKSRVFKGSNRALFLGEFFPREFGNILIESLDFFLSSTQGRSVHQVVFRPHPGGPEEQSLEASQRDRVTVSTSFSLAQDLADSHFVVGCNSFAMLVALEAGLPTFCALPPSYQGYKIDHPALIQIRSGVDSANR
tara:strand:- start:7015 stop:7911 length:897 start_codon:yes stop_codon:yes gene_type:complete